MCRRVDIVLADVSKERIASIFGVKEIRSLQPLSHAGSSLADFLYHEDGGDTFHEKVG